MNILTDRLPEAIKINDRIYPINTDFRDCLRIIMAFEDNELTPVEKQVILIDNLFQEKPAEDDLPVAIKKGTKFLNGGDENETDEIGLAPAMRLFSFSKDARFIFAAFQQTHGIDLQHTEYLHWWHFITLFMDLGAETTFSNLVGLRKRVKTGKASKEERKIAHEMGAIFTVPEIDTRSIEEKEKDREFIRMVEEARKRKKAQKAKDKR